MTEFDYIIVGAGSAGCVLANRLSANKAKSVLVLEAGGTDSHPYFGMPKGIAKLRLHPTYSWRFPVEPALGRNVGEVWPRGRVVGGTSSINGMFYVRGQPDDFDAWVRMGNSGWGWSDLAPCFIKMEDHALGASVERGAGGPLHISTVECPDPPNLAFLEAGQSLDLPLKADLNAGAQEGIGFYSLNTYRGGRWSAASAFLKPVRHRNNLTVHLNTPVDRIIFEGTRAVGVVCRHHGRSQEFRAREETILCAGTIKTPQILMLSGVGDPAELARHAIPIVCNSPRVGKGVREHLSMTVSHRLLSVAGENAEYRGLGLVKNVLRYYLTRTGPLSWSTFPIGGFARSRSDATRPDIQFFLGAVSFDAGGRDSVTSRVSPGKRPGVTCFAYYMHPTSEGRITLRSSDPAALPLIEPNWLDTEEDRRASIDTVKFMRRLLGAEPLKSYIGEEVTPGREVGGSDEELLRSYVRFGSTANHAIGSCAMGPGEEAVVDDRLRVRGTSCLRVVDLSVFPALPSGNTNAPVMAVAWRAADFISGAAA